MPIPKPKKNERKLEFINRCMADDVMTNEYKIAGQRYAVCTLSFEQTRQAEYQAKKEKKDKA
jgi:hypothetical protein